MLLSPLMFYYIFARKTLIRCSNLRNQQILHLFILCKTDGGLRRRKVYVVHCSSKLY
uniref:Uncharacterized protein n=1 Tax=Arundo donax TaxID=35708 RepID=A0A0A8ZUG6_ARUDO